MNIQLALSNASSKNGTLPGQTVQCSWQQFRIMSFTLPSPLALVQLAADSIRATTPCCVLWDFIVPSSFVTTEHQVSLKDRQMYKMCILQQDCNGLQHGLCILHRSLVHLYVHLPETKVLSTLCAGLNTWHHISARHMYVVGGCRLPCIPTILVTVARHVKKCMIGCASVQQKKCLPQLVWHHTSLLQPTSQAQQRQPVCTSAAASAIVPHSADLQNTRCLVMKMTTVARTGGPTKPRLVVFCKACANAEQAGLPWRIQLLLLLLLLLSLLLHLLG